MSARGTFDDGVDLGWGTYAKVFSALALFIFGVFTSGDKGTLILLLAWAISSSADSDVLNERLKAIQRRIG